MDVTNQILHDYLLDKKPEGASHDPEECAFCTEKASHQEGKVSADEKILSQEQHEQLLASAVEKAKAEALAEADAEILDLKGKLEASETATGEKDEEIKELKAEIADRDETSRLEKVADERVAKVKEIASFSDEQIAARRVVWAKMEDEVFASYLEDLGTAAAAKPKGDGAPKTTFDGTRETAGKEGTEQSVVSEFFDSGLAVAAQS